MTVIETGLILLKGDLVKFSAPKIFSDAERDYKSPGVVLKSWVDESFIGHTAPKAEVYWNNGKISVEHFCYLEKISFCSAK
tara:strand:- start:455 stop:697 length:243 start_codon:yes stop_codon:yes gene_type:complete